MLKVKLITTNKEKVKAKEEEKANKKMLKLTQALRKLDSKMKPYSEGTQYQFFEQYG